MEFEPFLLANNCRTGNVAGVEQTDPNLINSLSAGSQHPDFEEAWNEFMRRYGGFIRAFAMGRGFCASDADDFVQETLIGLACEEGRSNVFNRYESGKGSFHSWLAVVVKNRINSVIGRLVRQRRMEKADTEEFEGSDSLLERIAAAPEISSEAWEEVDLRVRALEELRKMVRKPRNFEAFLRLREGVKPAEVAREFEIKRGYVDKIRCQYDGMLDAILLALSGGQPPAPKTAGLFQWPVRAEVTVQVGHSTLPESVSQRIRKVQSMIKASRGLPEGPLLLWENGAGQLVHRLIDGPVIVGRDRLASIQVSSDPSLGRRHFRVYLDDSSCWVEDLNSSNGTRINDGVEPIARHELRDGDVIKAGSSIFAFLGSPDDVGGSPATVNRNGSQ